MKERIRALIKRTTEPVGHIITVDNTLQAFQRIVGGYIETVRIREDAILICNEEGMLQGLPINVFLDDDAIMGELIIVGADGDEFTDVPMDLNEWRGMLRKWGNQEVRS